MMGLVKPPLRYIDNRLVAIGERIRITSLSQTEVRGVGVVDVFCRGGGAGGGGEAELTGVDTANGERGKSGSSATLSGAMLSGSKEVTIGIGGDAGSNDTASPPSDAQAGGGESGGSTTFFVTAAGGSTYLSSRGGYVNWGGGNSYKSNYTQAPSAVSNPDGSDNGRGGYGRPHGFPSSPYLAKTGAVWLTLRN